MFRCVKYFSILLTLKFMAGCVGMQSWTPQDSDFTKFISKEELLEKHGSPDKNIHESTYIYTNKKNQWCGITLYAVVPIPFMAPVCSEETKYDIKDGYVKKITIKSVRKKGVICGPFVYFISGVMGFGQGQGDWCD